MGWKSASIRLPWRLHLPGRHLTLLGRFSLRSFFLLLAIGVALAWGIQRQMEDSALRQEAESAADQVRLMLRPNIWTANLRGPFTGDLYQKIDTLVHRGLLGSHIVRIKIWSPTGVVLYSDRADLIGRQFPVEDDIANAMQGQSSTDISDLTSEENVDERGQFTQLLETYVPLQPVDSPDIAGVYEIYEDPSVLQQRVDDIHRLVWMGVGMGFLLLYAGLFTLVGGASSALTRQRDALAASEKRFRAIFNGAAIGMALVDTEGRLVEGNPALEEMLGYSTAELRGRTFASLTHPEDVGTNLHLFAEMLEGKRDRYQMEKRYRRADGAVIWARLTSSPFSDEHGKPQFVIGMVEDITARKAAEAATGRQMQRLAALRSIDVAITSSLDLRVTLDVFLDKALAQLAVDAAHILLLNPHTQMLQSAAGRGFRTGAWTHQRLRLGEGYAGQAVLERRTVHIADFTATPDAATAAALAREQFVAYYAVPLLAKGQVKGVLELFHRTGLDPDTEWLDFMEALAGQAAIALDNAALFTDLQHSNLELGLAYDTTLEGWSRALDLRDKETQGHTQRVTEMTMLLARAMGVCESDLVHIRRGALLHDIGKMGIPDAVLNKPGPLTAEEWSVMRRHPVYAYELLAPIAFLRPALDIPYCHHEKWDGTGYPRGLQGEQIPLAARIFAVVDVWDALRSDRPYRPAWAEEQVRQHIRAAAGTHFDPQAVEAFLALEV